MSDTEQPDGLKRANDNPWYCLATLHGEQAPRSRNYYVAKDNRIAWNRWMAEALSDEKRADLVKLGFPESELVPFTPAEKDEFCAAFAIRSGLEKGTPPSPTASVDLNHTCFDRWVDFSGFLWPAVSFSSSTFSGRARFSSAMFSTRADFRWTTFSDQADFMSATFSMIGFFEGAKFLDHAYFERATFLHEARFRWVTFSAGSSFKLVTFLDNAYFQGTKFLGSAIFISTTFSENADFNSAKFSEAAEFGSATFSREVNFSQGEFFQSVNFMNTEFGANTVFAHVRFVTSVPDFRGAKMHEATAWHGTNWPPAPQEEDAAQAQVYAYERLKQEMERLKKHEDEQSFFRKELRARRGLVPRWSGSWLLNYAYEISSGFGQSILRPTLWLIVLLLLGVAVFAGFPVFDGARMGISRAAALSFANIFSFLPIKREIMTADMIVGLSSVAQIVGVLQSLFGIVLLFLLGLALRSRFRMR